MLRAMIQRESWVVDAPLGAQGAEALEAAELAAMTFGELLTGVCAGKNSVLPSVD